jgi:hypothetical protein
MKRLVMIATLLMLLGLTSQGISAQDASPAADATPTTPLLDALGYPTLSIAYDGSTVTVPQTLDAGRYKVDFTNTSGASPQVMVFLGATADHSVDDIMSALQSADTSQGPPPIYYQVNVVDLTGTDANSVITLTAGDWVLAIIGNNGPAVAQISVTGDLPTYDAIPNAVSVNLHEMAIDMPDTVAAGDTIFQIDNTGSMPHMFFLVKTNGPVTDEQVMNALAQELGSPVATPIESNSAADLASAPEVIDSATISNGHTQLVEANLEPGNYVALCFVEGPGDTGMHAMQGMYKIFTVE